jgi:hypothetical protein
MYGHSPNIIRNATTVKSESAKRLQDGIIKGSLNEFQKNGIDGLLKGGMPEHNKSKSEGNKPNLKASGKAPATQKEDGAVPIGGAKGKKSKK